eukprot:c15714_g1_i1 orf=364-1524(-)
MQDADATSQPGGGSTHVTGLDKRTSQNDTVRETQQDIRKDSLAAEGDQAMQHHTDMEVEKHSSKKNDHQESTPQGADHNIQSPSQQKGVDKLDKNSHLADSSMEKDTDRGVEGDGGHLAGNGMQMEECFEEISIQEDDLLKTVSEVLEARHLIETRPLPVLIKGKEVDLLKLCVQVRACGGYDRVTLWSSISKSVGFGQECGPLLKLVYVKYLKGLENRRLVASQVVQGLQNVLKRENEDAPVVKSESVKAQSKSRGITSARKKSNEEVPAIENPVIENSPAMLAESSDSLAGVLEWVKRLALNPGDPKKGQGVRVSRWSEAWAGKCETLAGRVRAVLWKNEEHPLHDLSSPPESQDQVQDPKKRGRGNTPRGKGVVVKKSRRLSS